VDGAGKTSTIAAAVVAVAALASERRDVGVAR
jgi:hypothetical protein